jgi:lipoprotein-anchoring transpeptidase ErfK/SrfK
VHQSQRPKKGHSVYSRNREALLAMTASAALLAGIATSADALPFNVQPAAPDTARASKPKPTVLAVRDKAPAKAKESEDVAAKARGVLSVVISIDKQHLTLYSDGRPIAHSRVSTGVPGHPTPTGVFSVIQKDRWHRSNIYDNAPMYYMQRITWSGVAMHQGIVPNAPASHGCIRLPEAFARQMWGITKLGVRVIVARNDVVPTPISNDRLFTFKQRDPVEPKPEQQATPTEPTNAAPGAPSATQFAANKDNATTSDAKSRNPALDAMAYAIGAPRETPVTTPETMKSGFQTFDANKARSANLGTGSAGEERPLKPGPISVFISRKEGKLFVRKGFDPVFEVPVTFEQPDRPLGTHVFTALTLNDDNTSFRWNVMTMPGGASPPAKKAEKVEKGKKVPVVAAPAEPVSNASEALNRISIPEDAVARISELMSPGASLIISDKGLGSETGKGTDFIVLTR